MRNLFVLVKKLPAFLKLSRCNKKILLEAFILTAIVRLIILSVPFNKYKRYFGKYNDETPFDIDSHEFETVERVSSAVHAISLYTLWKSSCLVQAVTAQRMLKSRNLCSTIYLGVNKDENNVMRAHAWLRCGRLFVTGGYYKCDFEEVAKFGN